jgi:hypothetical protein
MADAAHLRRIAERLLAGALQSPDEEIARELTARDSEYLDQAAALEAVPPAAEPPERAAREADVPQPKGGEK